MQGAVSKATVQDLKDTNLALEQALEHSGLGLVFKPDAISWETAIVVSVTDASFANETVIEPDVIEKPHRAQKAFMKDQDLKMAKMARMTRQASAERFVPQSASPSARKAPDSAALKPGAVLPEMSPDTLARKLSDPLCALPSRPLNFARRRDRAKLILLYHAPPPLGGLAAALAGILAAGWPRRAAKACRCRTPAGRRDHGQKV